MEDLDFTRKQRLLNHVLEVASERESVSIPEIQLALGMRYSLVREAVKQLEASGALISIDALRYKYVGYDVDNKIRAIVDRMIGLSELDQRICAAASACLQVGGVSTISIQRKLGVGFTRAARMYDQLKYSGFCTDDNADGKLRIAFTEAELSEIERLWNAEKNVKSDSDAPTSAEKPHEIIERNKLIDALVDEVTDSDADGDDSKSIFDDDEEFDIDVDALFDGDVDEANDERAEKKDENAVAENIDIDGMLGELERDRECSDNAHWLSLWYFGADRNKIISRIEKFRDKLNKDDDDFDRCENLIERFKAYTDEEAEMFLGNTRSRYAFLSIPDPQYVVKGRSAHTNDELMYNVHEGILRLVASECSDVATLVEKARNEANTKTDEWEKKISCAVANALEAMPPLVFKFVCDDIAESRATENKYKFPKPQRVDITYVIDGSNDGALFGWAERVIDGVERELSLCFDSAYGDLSARLRERIVCYGNSDFDGENTITDDRFFIMPYGKRHLSRLFGGARHKKKNTENKSNGMEAIWSALCQMESESDCDSDVRIVAVLTHNDVFAPGEKVVDESFPKDIEEYERMWHSQPPSTIALDKKRLFICAPENHDLSRFGWFNLTRWKKAGMQGYALDDHPLDIAAYIIMMCFKLLSD